MYTTAELLAIILALYSTSKHLLKPVFLLQSVESPQHHILNPNYTYHHTDCTDLILTAGKQTWKSNHRIFLCCLAYSFSGSGSYQIKS